MDVEDVSLTEVLNLLEVEPSSGSEGGVVPALTAPGPDIPALREQLAVLVSTGSKTTESLIDSFIFLATKMVGMFIKVKDIDAYKKELRNDYIFTKELSTLCGKAALKGNGKVLAAANAVLITGKHVDFDPMLEKKTELKLEEIPQQSSTTAEELQTNPL